MVGIIDYGVGNLFSLRSSFKAIGQEAFVSGDPAELEKASRLVLPGVGAFGDAAEKLRQSGLDGFVRTQAASGKPLLGICLGMQLLFESSTEGGYHAGLGLIPSKIVRFPADMGLKVPHMGWNNLAPRAGSVLFNNTSDAPYVYFVHSYYAAEVSEAWTAATCTYGVTFTAAVQRGNVFGTQYHPEKSSAAGLQMLRNFIEYKEADAAC